MANQEHVDILDQGVDVWNKWREENPDIKVDLSNIGLLFRTLSNVNFSGANLSHASLTVANLQKANLSKADLREAEFEATELDEANLSKANLSRANLQGASLRGADLDGADLSYADLSGKDISTVNLRQAANLIGINLQKGYLLGTDLSGMDLSEANFSGALLSPAGLSLDDIYEIFGSMNPEEGDLDEVNLSGATLKGANFNNVGLRNVNLRGANLYEANLSDADLSNADLRGANLSRAKLSGSKLTGTKIEGADLSYADLSETFLVGRDFREAKLGGADLSGTNLFMANFIGADLSWATLIGADLREAKLQGANLTGANLTGANLSKSDLTEAKLISSWIYAISAWDVKLERTSQEDLIITPYNECPIIRVDNIKVAQFIYLLLNNKEIRDVIDTITSKVILILGRFTSEREQVLDALRDELYENYSPVVFNLEEHNSGNFIETARTLANMAHFVLVDLTDLDDVIREIASSIIPRCNTPVQPLLLGNYQYDRALFQDLRQKCSWVLSPRRYNDISGLLASFQEQIIQPAENKIIELKQKKPLKICFGSAPEDRDMLDRLKKHLSVLERSGQIEMWDDRDIEPGINRDDEIDRQLFGARIILLLISPDFLASNDCYALQEKAMEGNAKVIPILLRSCAWKSTPLGSLQVLPRDERPVDKHSLDEVFFEVSEEISDVIKEMM